MYLPTRSYISLGLKLTNASPPTAIAAAFNRPTPVDKIHIRKTGGNVRNCKLLRHCLVIAVSNRTTGSFKSYIFKTLPKSKD